MRREGGKSWEGQRKDFKSTDNLRFLEIHGHIGIAFIITMSMLNIFSIQFCMLCVSRKYFQIFLKPPGGTPNWHLDFGLLISRTVG